jgi:UPF0148 protein
MSDTDDGFDEEAVREELREKYADDEQEREATARMSELLLQGATMTNQHCDRCGSPIFRYEGQSFCPECQAPGQASGQQGGQQGGHQAGQQAEPGTEQQGAQEAADQQPTRQEREQSDQQSVERVRRQGDARTPADSRRQAERTDSAPERANPPQPRRQSDADLPATQQGGESVDALESSIAALARRGASADDPRTAREYLEAAREAAEALAALRRNA